MLNCGRIIIGEVMSISVDVLKDYVRLEELSVRIRRGERVSIEDGIESLDYNFTLRKAREAYCKSKKAESIFRRLMLWFSNVFSKMKVSKKQKNQPMNSCRGWGPGIHHPFIMYYEKTCPMCELIKKLKNLHGLIEIRVSRKKSGCLLIGVTDNGIGLSHEESAGNHIGMKIIKERLMLIGKESEIIITPLEPGFMVELIICID